MAIYFSQGEIEGLKPALVAMLDRARHLAGVPFLITSGYRDPAHNAGLVGAVKDSAHTTGLAVDLHVEDDHAFERIIFGLLGAGFTRLGLYYSLEGSKLIPRHIHVDCDVSKPAEVIWSLIETN